MMIHPQFDPVLISIGPLAIRWYALSYIVGFILFTILAAAVSRRAILCLPKKHSTIS